MACWRPLVELKATAKHIMDYFVIDYMTINPEMKVRGRGDVLKHKNPINEQIKAVERELAILDAKRES